MVSISRLGIGILSGAAIKNTNAVTTFLVGSGASTLGQLTGSSANSFINNNFVLNGVLVYQRVLKR
jgi:phosphoketolase